MNQPNDQTGQPPSQSSFPSQPSQSNPFTADLKGEFTSNFGTNTTNAVSQIFKDGNFGENNKLKMGLLALAGVVLVVVLGLTFFGEDEPPVMPDMENPETATAGEEALPTTDGEVAPDAMSTEAAAPVEEAVEEAAPAASGRC